MYIYISINLLLSILLKRLNVSLAAIIDAPIQRSPTFSTYLSPTFNVSEKLPEDAVDILPPIYYRDVAPTVNGKPVKVQVSIMIHSLRLSSGSSQDFEADFFYHNYWSDYRLQKPSNDAAIPQRINISAKESLPHYKLNYGWRNRLWVPDTYFSNAISGSVSNIITPTHYFTITNYTEVFMSVRLKLRLSCQMHFEKFPFDQQKCFINITMTSEDINSVVLDWDMFRVGPRIDVTEFEIVRFDKKSCTANIDIGIFSCLYGEIVFKRHIGNYMIKRFIPSFCIVLMSFIGFWIPTRIAPARTTLPVTALLALVTQQIKSDLNVSYVYALQVWNIVCVMFVFANVVEFSLAMYVLHMAHKRRNAKTTGKRYSTYKDYGGRLSIVQEKIEEKSIVVDNSKRWLRVKKFFQKRFRTTSRHSAVDHVSRILFPVSFGFFVIGFYIHCIYF